MTRTGVTESRIYTAKMPGIFTAVIGVRSLPKEDAMLAISFFLQSCFDSGIAFK